MKFTCFKPQGTVNRWLAVSFCVAILLFATKMNAQTAGTGNIQGTVLDSSGAIVANAAVTVTETSTQVNHTTRTSNAGVYVFPGLPIGTYTLGVAVAGFETYEQTGIVLEVGSSIAVNATLTVGRADVKVEVHAEGLALQTEDASFKQTVDQQDITEMPLNSASRQITGLLGLTGGANTAPALDFTGSKYSYQTISISIAGGNGNTTLWRLDGGDNQDYMGNGNLPYPFPDALSQFSVESTVLGAQDGEHTGGMVNAVTRSGTNTYHGSAFEFIRNNWKDGTNFFSSCTPIPPATTCSPKDQLHQNQFGGTFGGKIIRDKFFAFAAYQHLISKQLQANTKAVIPTAANLLGDFSTTDGNPLVPGSNGCATNGKPIQLYDPLTSTPTPLVGNKYASPPTYNQQALNLQKYLPAINPLYDTGNCGDVSYAIPLDLYDNEFVTRVDYTINQNNNIYGRYFVDGYQAPAFFSPTNILITTQSGNIQRTQSFTLGENYTVNQNLVNSAHLTILRRVNNRGYAPNDINANTIGITDYQMEASGLYLTTGSGSSHFTIGGGTNSISHFNDNTLALDDDVTWVRGKHQVIFGGEWVQNQLNIGNVYEGNGIFTFNGEYSFNGANGGSSVGDPNLDFLQGTMSAYQQSKQQQNAMRGAIPSLYVQDTFHATSRLTFVAGLRWGPNFMPTDFFYRGSVFNQAAFTAGSGSSVYTQAPYGVFFYGDQGVSKEFTQNSPWQFSPNIGLSFDPFGNGKTVIRAGAGLAYDKPNFFTGQRDQQNPPFATAVSNAQTASTGPLSLSAPWSVGQFKADPFPQPPVPTLSYCNTTPFPAPGQNPCFFAQSQYQVLDPNFKAAYTMQWTLSIQHQFAHGWQAQIDYIGNRTVHDPIAEPLSPAVFIPGTWSGGCAGIVTQGPAAATGSGTANCSTTKNQASRFLLTTLNHGTSPAATDRGGNQILGGGAGSVVITDAAFGDYNGMVASIQHRLSSTFSLLANWTFSKCLDIVDGQGDPTAQLYEQPNNPRADYGPCGFDYRHIENVVLVAHSNFHPTNRIVKQTINNWELAPLIHIASGTAINVTAGADYSLTDSGYDRPNLVAGVNPYAKVKFGSGTGEANRELLNPLAFQQVVVNCTSTTTGACPQLGTFGNIGRNAFRATPSLQFDAQVSRSIQMYKSLALLLRLEAFNVLNHPNFGNPATNLSTTSSFGQVSSTTNQARVFQGSVKITF